MSRSYNPGSDGDSATSNLSKLVWLFLFALSIRWIYTLSIYAAMSDGGIMAGDSTGYVRNARRMAELITANELTGWQWLGLDISVMPVLSSLLALNMLAFGDNGPLLYVMQQGVFDAATCLLVYGIAATLNEKIALAAGIAAAINPTQIVMAGLVYTDTPFLLFVAISLFGAMRWLRQPSLGTALTIGIGLGGALLTRILIVPWIAILVVFLLATVLLRRTFEPRHLGHAALIGGLAALCVAPIVLRNWSEYRVFAITAQGGSHLAYWVVPLVKEAQDGTPWERTADLMRKRVMARDPAAFTKAFEGSHVSAEVGREALKELGYVAIAKAWITGAVINIASPAIILSPVVSQLPRTGFFGTTGASPIEKIFNYIFRSDNRLYAIILILGIAGVAIIRLLQLVGLTALIDARNAPGILLLLSWIFYILAVNGPIASPKYRLPMEPALNVFTGAGFVALRDWRRRRSQRKA